jgi:hypothetical protein
MLTKITIDASKMDTLERREKIQTVAGELHTVINSRIFMDEVMKMRTHGERSKLKDLSNREIYDLLMKGAETLDPEVDYEWDIFVDDYYTFKRVVGYTYLNKKWIYVNTKYFDTRSTKLIGSNIVHEQSHKLGFSHDFRSTKDRPFSVSYQLNLAYERAYDRIYGKEIKTKKKVCSRSWRRLWIKKCKWIEV